MDCVKCSYREAMADSPFCEVCSRGIDNILGPTHRADFLSHKPKRSFQRAPSSGSAKSPPEGAFAHRKERERICRAISEQLEQIPVIRLAEFKRIRPDIRKITERYPFDGIGWYDSRTNKIDMNSDAVSLLSSVLACDPISLEHVIRLHAVFHKALHGYLSDDYDTIDHRLIEHYIHHMMFYLLIDPKHVRELFPSLFQTLRRLSEDGTYYRVFLAIHELQPEDCRVRDNDFAAYPPTWVIDSLSIVRRYRVKDFAEWDRFLFCRAGRSSQPQSLFPMDLA